MKSKTNNRRVVKATRKPISRKSKRPLWKKILTYGLPAVAVLAGILMITKSGNATPNPGTGTGTGVAVDCSKYPPVFPIGQGYGYSNDCENAIAKKIQVYLNTKPLSPLPLLIVDGKIGIKTLAAASKIFLHPYISATNYQTVLNPPV
jgi:hypothetical protein